MANADAVWSTKKALASKIRLFRVKVRHQFGFGFFFFLTIGTSRQKVSESKRVRNTPHQRHAGAFLRSDIRRSTKLSLRAMAEAVLRSESASNLRHLARLSPRSRETD